jgi:hypothetical protein
MTELTGKVGFASAVSTKRIARCRIVGVELIATMALVVCLIIAVTAVSIGMARAQAFANVGRNDHAPFAVALFFGPVMAGMGGLTAMVAGDRQTPRD